LCDKTISRAQGNNTWPERTLRIAQETARVTFGAGRQSARQHFGGQNGLPSKQKPSVGVIFPEVVQSWTLHHLAVLHGPVHRAPAVQACFAAAFFFAAKAGCAAAKATMAAASESVAISLVMENLSSDRPIRFGEDRMAKMSPQAAGRRMSVG
jgi:hypothetical protein